MRRSLEEPLYEPDDNRFELGLFGLRVLAGRRLPRRHRGARIVAVASDVDEDAGVAAVWMVRDGGRAGGIEEICQYERVAGTWQYTGGGGTNSVSFASVGRRSAGVAGQASMLTYLGGRGGRSRADRETQGDQLDRSRAGWTAAATFRVAAEVTHLQVGARRVRVPEHGHVAVAWKTPAGERPRRPPITALGADGSILSEFGPDDHLDTLTWAAIEKAIG